VEDERPDRLIRVWGLTGTIKRRQMFFHSARVHVRYALRPGRVIHEVVWVGPLITAAGELDFESRGGGQSPPGLPVHHGPDSQSGHPQLPG
jgi:hypothetical protein